ncbi:HXXEE domain-containing protein [Xylanibacillus composti]|nr:HXXEE domain-containing protein [Xylanibacillus composti]MDT9723561.1 HXXEE domain-containing protein [Xylanibacillus composti]
MLPVLDSAISIQSLIWLFLAAFMLHDFEEIIRIEPWFRKHRNVIFARVPAWFHKDLQPFSRMTSSQFAVAVCVEFVIFIPCTYLAAEKGMYLMFLGFNTVMLLHVFTHVGQALFVRMLTPGVITAVAVVLPYSLYLFYRLLNENLVSLSDILISLPFGLTLVPIVLFGHKLGERLIPMSNHTSEKEVDYAANPNCGM